LLTSQTYSPARRFPVAGALCIVAALAVITVRRSSGAGTLIPSPAAAPAPG